MTLAHPGAEERESRGPSAFGPIGPVAIAAIVGALVLPATIGTIARHARTGLSLAALLWLAGALLASAWILALAPRLAGMLRNRLMSLPGDPPAARRLAEGHRPSLLAALLVALIDVALVEATLRPPIHQAFGRATVPVDTVVASLFFVLFLGLALRLYLAAAPWLEVGARAALDALVPTTASDASARFAAEDERRTRVAPTDVARPIDALAPTELASTRQREALASDPTPTRPAVIWPADLTSPAPRDPDATQAAPTRLAADDPTEPAPRSARRPPTNLQFRSPSRRSADAMLLDILAETMPRPISSSFDPAGSMADSSRPTREI